MSVAAVVVAYRSAATLELCLRSLIDGGGLAEIVMVDNASGDSSAEIAEALGVRVIRSKENLGFGGGVNLGISNTDADYVFVVNPDAEVEAGTANGLSGYLERNPSAAIVASDLVGPDSVPLPVRRRFPAWWRAPLEPGVAGRLDDRHYRRRTSDRVDWVSGAAFMIRRRAFDAIRGFDSRFFLYSEEVDLAYRLRTAGWEVHWVPGYPTLHREGHSTATLPSGGKVEWVEGYLTFSELHSAHPRLDRLMLSCGLFGRAAVWAVRGRRNQARLWWLAARAAT